MLPGLSVATVLELQLERQRKTLGACFMQRVLSSSHLSCLSVLSVDRRRAPVTGTSKGWCYMIQTLAPAPGCGTPGCGRPGRQEDAGWKHTLDPLRSPRATDTGRI